MKQISVTFDLTEDMEAALLEILPFWQQYEGKGGSRPFENMTPEKLFETIMQAGIWHTIWRHIKSEQYRNGAITGAELLDDKELTVAQRVAERQQAAKEGGSQ